MKTLVLICLMSVSLGAGPILALISAEPEPDSPVLVLSVPWLDPSASVLAAGGQLIGPVSAPIAVLATGSDPDFLERLAEMPGTLVRGGRQLAALCGLVT